MAKRKIRRVYVAGAITPNSGNQNPAIEHMLNLKNMIRAGIDLFLAGYDPYIPGLDCLMFLELRDDERITESMIYQFSKSWLQVCDAIFLLKGWEKSKGTLAELELAKKLGIPIFESIEELKNYEFKNTSQKMIRITSGVA